MSNEVTFVNGMIAKRQDNAPDFVLCNISLKVEELIQFMQQHNNNGWVNVDIKRSKAGKVFASLNTWKPNGQAQGQVNQGFGQQSQPNDSFNQRFPQAQGTTEDVPF